MKFINQILCSALALSLIVTPSEAALWSPSPKAPILQSSLFTSGAFLSRQVVAWRPAGVRLAATITALLATACVPIYNKNNLPAVHPIAGEGAADDIKANFNLPKRDVQSPSTILPLTSPDDIPALVIRQNRPMAVRFAEDRRVLSNALSFAAFQYTYVLNVSGPYSLGIGNGPHTLTQPKDGVSLALGVPELMYLDQREYALTPPKPTTAKSAAYTVWNSLLDFVMGGFVWSDKHTIEQRRQTYAKAAMESQSVRAISRQEFLNQVRTAQRLTLDLNQRDFARGQTHAAIRFLQALLQRQRSSVSGASKSIASYTESNNELIRLRQEADSLSGERQRIAASLQEIVTWSRTDSAATIGALATLRPLGRVEFEYYAQAFRTSADSLSLVPAEALEQALRRRLGANATVQDPLTVPGMAAFWGAFLPGALSDTLVKQIPSGISPADLIKGLSADSLALSPTEVSMEFSKLALAADSSALRAGNHFSWQGGIASGILVPMAPILSVSPFLKFGMPQDRSQAQLRMNADAAGIVAADHQLKVFQNAATTEAKLAYLRYRTARQRFLTAYADAARSSRDFYNALNAGPLVNADYLTPKQRYDQAAWTGARALQEMADALRLLRSYHADGPGGQSELLQKFLTNEKRMVDELQADSVKARPATIVAPEGAPQKPSGKGALIGSILKKAGMATLASALLPNVALAYTFTKNAAGALVATAEKGDVLSGLAVKMLRLADPTHAGKFSQGAIRGMVDQLAQGAQMANPDHLTIGQQFVVTPAPEVVHQAAQVAQVVTQPAAVVDPTPALQVAHSFPMGPVLLGITLAIVIISLAVLYVRSRRHGTPFRRWAVTGLLVVTAFAGLGFSQLSARPTEPSQAVPPPVQIAPTPAATIPAPVTPAPFTYVAQLGEKGVVRHVGAQTPLKKNNVVIAWTGLSRATLDTLKQLSDKWSPILGGTMIPVQDLNAATKAAAAASRAPIVIESAMEAGSLPLTSLEAINTLTGILDRLETVQQTGAYNRSVDPSLPLSPEEIYLPTIAKAQAELVGALVRQTAERNSFANTPFTFIPLPESLSGKTVTDGRPDTLFTATPGESPALTQQNPAQAIARQKAALGKILTGYQQLVAALKEQQAKAPEQAGDIQERIDSINATIRSIQTYRTALSKRADFIAKAAIPSLGLAGTIGSSFLTRLSAFFLTWLEMIPGLGFLIRRQRQRRTPAHAERFAYSA